MSELNFRFSSWKNWGSAGRNSKIVREVWSSRKSEEFEIRHPCEKDGSEHLRLVRDVWTRPVVWFQAGLFLPGSDVPGGNLTASEFHVLDWQRAKQLAGSPELIKIPRDMCSLRFLYVCFELNNSFWQAFSLQQSGSMFWWEGEEKSLWFVCFWVPAGGPAPPWASLLFWTLEAILAQLWECQLVLEARE